MAEHELLEDVELVWPTANGGVRRRIVTARTVPIGRVIDDLVSIGTVGSAAAPSASSNRSSVSARCAPRFVDTIAWISSTMTVSTSFNAAPAEDESTR